MSVHPEKLFQQDPKLDETRVSLEKDPVINDDVDLIKEFIKFKTDVANELTALKQENQHLKDQISLFPDESINSWKDLTNELIAIFSLNGSSKLLGTNNLFRKFFWLICMAGLTYGGVYYVISNVQSYQAFEVVTQIEVKYQDKMTFPAITFCVLQMDFGDYFTATIDHQANFSQVFVACMFETWTNGCNPDDFEYTPIYSVAFDLLYQCYKFNSGKKKQIFTGSRVGIYSGLVIEFNVSISEQIYYFVGDNNVEPIFTELNNIVQKKEDGKFVSIEIKKTVDNKLPEPFSDCTEKINSETSDLVKQITEKNITYRQKNCYDLCFNKYLDDFAATYQVNKGMAYLLVDFDYSGNCSGKCPLECDTTSFEIFRTESRSSLNILLMNFYYSDHKYTEIMQIEKTSMADLISNAGGVLGLFLELSFFTLYRLINAFFDIIF